MPVGRVLSGIALLLTLSLTGVASVLPGDPDIALDPGAASMPLKLGTNFAQGQPTDYYNPFADIITALTFDVTMNSGLTCTSAPGSLDCSATPGGPSIGSFHCNSGYFLGCGFTYTSGNGGLAIDFAGVNPWDGDPTDSLVDKMQGIPPLLPGCLPTPENPAQQDTKGCSVVGHFDIGLDGWTSTASPQFFTGTPTFQVTEVDLAPEPRTEILIGSVLLLAAGLVGMRRRRRASR